MIFVISPAKALDYEAPPTTATHSLPEYLDQAEELIRILRTRTPAEISDLMGLSDKLAALNVARYEAWSRPFTPGNSKQAVLAFDGDVYDGLDAKSLSEEELDWAQRHLRILSGLYGLLRPLDLMQPYRLEMGSRLENPAGRNLYAYWGDKLALGLDRLLAGERANGEEPVLVNLASEEYFKSVRADRLSGPVVSPVFEDWKDGRYRIISFFAKRARGAMVRYAIQNRIRSVDALTGFDSEGYAFVPEASDELRPVFRRRRD